MISGEILQETVEEQHLYFSKLSGLTRRRLLNDIPLSVNHAVIISGLRRCGKSVLLLQFSKEISKFHYFNFEDLRITGFDYTGFTKLDKIFTKRGSEINYYLFDEIQNIDKWEIYIRTLLDKGKKVYLTGSNASLLSKELGTKLTGRNLRYELFPFSFSEFLQFKNEKAGIESFEEYFINGGIPEYLQFPNIKVLQDLVNDILFRDIIVRYNIRNYSGLQQVVNYFFSNIGKEFSYRKLQKVFSISSVNTIIGYLKYLEDSYLLFSIPKFDYSLKKQAVNPKKVYAIDSGLIKANSLSFSRDSGRILENIVFVHLKRNGLDVFYFSKKNECDFVAVENGQVVAAIQVCYQINEDNLQRELSGVSEAVAFFKLQNGHILTHNSSDEFIHDGQQVIVKPVWQWLLEF